MRILDGEHEVRRRRGNRECDVGRGHLDGRIGKREGVDEQVCATAHHEVELELRSIFDVGIVIAVDLGSVKE